MQVEGKKSQRFIKKLPNRLHIFLFYITVFLEKQGVTLGKFNCELLHEFIIISKILKPFTLKMCFFMYMEKFLSKLVILNQNSEGEEAILYGIVEEASTVLLQNIDFSKSKSQTEHENSLPFIYEGLSKKLSFAGSLFDLSEVVHRTIFYKFNVPGQVYDQLDMISPHSIQNTLQNRQSGLIDFQIKVTMNVTQRR